MRERITALHAARLFLAKFQKSHLILPMTFLNATSFSGLGLGMVFYLRGEFGASAGTIGLTTAFQWGAYLAGNFALRPLTRILLPRHSLIISSAITAVLTMVVIQARQMNVAIIAYAAIGFGMALFWPPIMGWLSAGVEGAKLNRKIAGFNLSWSSGVIVGPFLAGLLTEVNPRFPLYAGAAGFVLVNIIIVMASIFMESIRTDTHRDPPRNGTRIPDKSTPLRYPSWVGMFGAYVILGALVVVFPLFGREQLGFREGVIGSMLLVRGFASTVAFVLAGRTVLWHFKKVPIIAPIVVLIGIAVALAFSNSLLHFALVFPIVGFAIAASYSASVFHGVVGSAERARRMGVHEALLTAGIVVGSLGGGILYQRADIYTVFVACAVLLAVVLMVQLALVVKR